MRRDYTNKLLFNFHSHRHILNLNRREKQTQMKGKLHYEMEPFRVMEEDELNKSINIHGIF